MIKRTIFVPINNFIDFMEPLVSVLIPTYNCEKYISAAIGSILSQTFTDFELVLCDDASSDGTPAIINTFNDPRIRLCVNEKNMGTSATRNKLSSLARGKLLAFMDCDDLAMPRRLEKQVAYMKRHPDVAICGTWVRTVDDEGKPSFSAVRDYSWNSVMQVALLFYPPLFQSTIMGRAEIMRENPYRPEFRQVEDYDIFCRIADNHKIGNVSKYLGAYRWHGSNASVLKRQEQENNAARIHRLQLAKLGIEPTRREMELMRVTFGWQLFGKETHNRSDTGELMEWYRKLIEANKQTGRYSRSALRAFLWSRWALFCRRSGQTGKAFFPGFASANPAVLLRLTRIILYSFRR